MSLAKQTKSADEVIEKYLRHHKRLIQNYESVIRSWLIEYSPENPNLLSFRSRYPNYVFERDLCWYLEDLITAIHSELTKAQPQALT